MLLIVSHEQQIMFYSFKAYLVYIHVIYLVMLLHDIIFKTTSFEEGKSEAKLF